MSILNVGDETMNLADLDLWDEPQYVIERLGMGPGKLVTLCGTGSSGKTFFAQYLAACVATGSYMFDKFEVDEGKVVHIDQEQDLRLTHMRYSRLLNGLNSPSDNISRIANVERITPANMATWEKELTELATGKSLIIIDSLKAISTADENSADIEQPMKLFKRVAERTNSCILLIHHKGKGQQTSKQTGRGHSSIYDSVDVQIDLDSDGLLYKITCAKIRDGKYFNGLSFTIEDTGRYIEKQRVTSKIEFKFVRELFKVKTGDILQDLIKEHLKLGEVNQTSLLVAVKGDKRKFLEELKALTDKGDICVRKGLKNANFYSLRKAPVVNDMLNEIEELVE